LPPFPRRHILPRRSRSPSCHFPLSDNYDIDLKLSELQRILDFVDGFEQKYGEKMVHYRTWNVELQARLVEAWWPGSNDEFAFTVEYDLEVSKIYYEFVMTLIWVCGTDFCFDLDVKLEDEEEGKR
jgi:hypothetical protein